MIKVYVFDKGRTNYYLRYIDPATGKPVDRSAGTADYGKAQRAAAKLEEELNAGRGIPGRISWEEFRDRYEAEHLSGLADATRRKWHSVASAVERHLRPRYLAELTAERISRLAASLRNEKEEGSADPVRGETTIDGYLAVLKAALNWAAGVRLIPACPPFPKVRRSKRNRKGAPMKGRPLSEAEFQAFCDAVPAVVGEERADAWRFYCRGLWLSGLRLEESLDLWWDGGDGLVIDLSGEFPMLRVAAEAEKGHRDRLLPIVPDFAELLLAVPPAERTGRVFDLSSRGGKPHRVWHVSKVGSKLGEAAGVVVSAKGRKVKYASFHDLRRSFGFRWSRKVMPAVLKELMRHEDISTTMKYYVGVNADDTARMLWGLGGRRQGDTLGDTPPPPAT